MSLKKKVESYKLTPKQINELIKSVQSNSLSEKQQKILLILIQQLRDTQKTASERQALVNRAKRLFESKTEKQKSSSRKKDNKAKAKGHGRNGVDNYKIAHEYEYEHELEVGSVCKLCGKGKLVNLEPKKVIRLVGQPAVIAELHRSQRLRCSACGAISTAKFPVEIGDAKYTDSANALVAVYRYGMGIPHYRLASMQKAMGVPLPSSTQYEMSELLWTKVVPIYKQLIKEAANLPIIYTDDTTGKIISLLKNKEERKKKKERVGIFTTGIVAKGNGKQINLFFTGIKHAGENLAKLLDSRDPELEIPIQVGDAATRNIPKDHMTQLVLCLAHARRNFYDCFGSFQDEVTYVINKIAIVYKNEKIIVNEKLNPAKRLEYHRKYSKQAMEELLEYSKNKINNKEVEPNSVLGGAFKYLIKHWEGLSQFYKIEGAPLDNNTAERLIKKAVLHRKNSMFYKTEDGAKVGDALMSIIQTAISTKIDPFDYLITLQKNSLAVAKNPQLWLPWNFKIMLKSVTSKK